MVEGDYHFDKSQLDLTSGNSFANFELSGVIKQKIPKELLTLLDDDPLSVKFKALRLVVVNKKSTDEWDANHNLVLNENGGWEKIQMNIN